MCMVSNSCFNLHFQMKKDVKHTLYAYFFYIFFGELSVHIFLPVFKLGCLFSHCWVLKSVYVLETSALCALQIFSPSLWMWIGFNYLKSTYNKAIL